jgi:hypothetical protein
MCEALPTLPITPSCLAVVWEQFYYKTLLLKNIFKFLLPFCSSEQRNETILIQKKARGS